MRRTKNMTYNETVESQELKLWVDNDYDTYKRLDYLWSNYNKKIEKGCFDYEKAVSGVYNVIETAVKKYDKDFGYKFTTCERWTASCQVLGDYLIENWDADYFEIMDILNNL